MEINTKKLIVILYLMSQSIFLNAQTITGKLVDQNNIGLSGFQLQLYIHPNVFSTTSDASGSFIFNSVTEVKENKLPAGYSVSDNFPNPFNPKTRIFITLPNSGNVKVNIYNILGQKVLADMDRYFNAGTSYIDLELKGLPNGIYIANISIDEKYKVVKKIMLLYGSQHLNTSVVTEQNISSNQPKSLSKTSSSVNIDSLVVTGSTINKIEYTNLPSYTGVPLNLGNLSVNTACTGIPTVTYAGQTYHTVQIGSQCWFRENLNVGTMIDGTKDQTNNNIIEKYCYNDSTINCDKYGGLYQWAEAVQYQNGATNTISPNPAFSEDVQGICPNGWHIPTISELQTLNLEANNDENALLTIGQGNSQYGVNGKNTSGFSLLLTGYRDYSSVFFGLGRQIFFWSSTNSFAGTAYVMFLVYGDFNDSGFYLGYYANDAYGCSIRCLKD
jgi:uncharacterized protein (TIGR02145 family)